MESAIQTTGTLPEWFIPGCIAILDSQTLTPAQKVGCLQNQFAGVASWGTRVNGNGAIEQERQATGLTKTEILSYLPEGNEGTPLSNLEQTLRTKYADAAVDRMLRFAFGDKRGYLVNQNGIVFRRPTQEGSIAQPTARSTEQTADAEAVQHEAERRAA